MKLSNGNAHREFQRPARTNPVPNQHRPDRRRKRVLAAAERRERGVS